MKSLTTKFAFASIYILFTALIISGVSVKYGECQPLLDPCAPDNPQDECPCNYNVVPKTTECWGESMHSTGNPVFQPCMVGSCDSTTDACALYRINFFNGSANDLSVYSKPLGKSHYVQLCSVRFQSTKGCQAGANQSHQLTAEEENTCLCRLAQYANELSQVDDGIVIDSTQNPPYSCEPTN